MARRQRLLGLIVFVTGCGNMACDNGAKHMKDAAKNVLGQPLQPCCTDPVTGYFRDGFCRTDDRDRGMHVVCAVMTQEFLAFTRGKGNDLTTPNPASGFPGLRPGDKWCLCALRWAEARKAGVAPPVRLQSTHAKALDVVSLATLRAHALPSDSS